MKRAKIMLSALGVLAVIGSALAFKANRAYTGAWRCSETTLETTTTATTTNCTIMAFVSNTNGVIRYCTSRLAPANEPCFATRRMLFNQ